MGDGAQGPVEDRQAAGMVLGEPVPDLADGLFDGLGFRAKPLPAFGEIFERNGAERRPEFRPGGSLRLR